MRKCFIALFTSFLFSTLALAQSFETPTRSPSQIISNIVHQYMNRNNVAGVAIAFYNQGKITFYNFGVANTTTNTPVTQNTLFELGSVTKVFTATLFALELTTGKMSLKNSLGNYLPAAIVSQNPAVNQITLQMLATHTAGLPTIPPGIKLAMYANYSKQDLINYLSTWQPQPMYPLGTHYHYSNIGFGFLGYAVEQAAHQSYAQLLQQYILQPLAMTTTTLNLPNGSNSFAQGYDGQGTPVPPWTPVGWIEAGGLRSSAADMAQFLRANLGDTQNKVLHQAMQLAQQPYFPINATAQQGLGWEINQINGYTAISKGGATNGFKCFIAMIPSQQIGIVMLANNVNGKVKPAVKTMLRNITRSLISIPMES